MESTTTTSQIYRQFVRDCNVVPFAPVNYHTRNGNPEWIRLGFVYARAFDDDNECHEQQHQQQQKLKGHRGSSLAKVYYHNGGKMNEKDNDDAKHDDATYHEHQHYHHHHHDGYPRRYPLFGRKVDFGRCLWEYVVYDAHSDVRIPLYLPRDKNELYDGDVVHIEGESGAFVVNLSEYDNYWNLSGLPVY